MEKISPAITHLQKLATTQEQKHFIKAYEVFLRVAFALCREYMRVMVVWLFS
ncbi:hypothetical protein [Helicobacter sp.]|uniref:hypothetical protein n=1 Tax=Helicobacter sp. TaxID=218 RepID=UPI0025BB3C19|nr:hypothetical protein [Helicobacter sp.]MBR2494918.1 hypothetical protein [Helicobacter sp.]